MQIAPAIAAVKLPGLAVQPLSTKRLVESVRWIRDAYEVLREKVLVDPPSGDAMCLSYRRLIQRLIAEAR